jgi:hypothetical protein
MDSLMDIGAERTICNTAHGAGRLQPRPSDRRVTVSITTADGAMAPKQGWLIKKLSVTCRGTRLACHNVLAMDLPDLPYGLVVGNDTLKRGQAVIDCAAGTVTFPHGKWSAPGPQRWEPTESISPARARRLARKGRGRIIEIDKIDPAILQEAASAASFNIAAHLHHVAVTAGATAAGTATPPAVPRPWENHPVYEPDPALDDPTPAERLAKIAALLERFRGSTTQKDNLPHAERHPRVGAMDGLELSIDTDDDAFRRLRPRPPRRLSLEEGQELRRQLVHLLSRGFIRPSISPYAAPCFFVPKGDGSQVRMVIDYRQVNSVTVPSQTPAPSAVEQVKFLGGSKWISSIDLTSA